MEIGIIQETIIRIKNLFVGNILERYINNSDRAVYNPPLVILLVFVFAI